MKPEPSRSPEPPHAPASVAVEHEMRTRRRIDTKLMTTGAYALLAEGPRQRLDYTGIVRPAAPPSRVTAQSIARQAPPLSWFVTHSDLSESQLPLSHSLGASQAPPSGFFAAHVPVFWSQ